VTALPLLLLCDSGSESIPVRPGPAVTVPLEFAERRVT
jgi:hypothetical protein